MIENYYEDNTIIAKEGEEIHFFAYGYYCEDDLSEKPYRFVEYTFFYGALKEIMEMGFSDFESEVGCEYKQYVEDVDRNTMIKYYQSYGEGNHPLFVCEDDINEELRDGYYIVVKKDDMAKILADESVDPNLIYAPIKRAA